MAQLGLQEIVPDQILKATEKQGLEKQQQKTPKPKTKSIKAVSIKKAFNSGSRGPETLQTSQAYPPPQHRILSQESDGTEEENFRDFY